MSPVFDRKTVPLNKHWKIPCSAKPNFPAQLMQGIPWQVIEAANLPGPASRGGGQIRENSLLNSLLAGNRIAIIADYDAQSAVEREWCCVWPASSPGTIKMIAAYDRRTRPRLSMTRHGAI